MNFIQQLQSFQNGLVFEDHQTIVFGLHIITPTIPSWQPHTFRESLLLIRSSLLVGMVLARDASFFSAPSSHSKSGSCVSWNCFAMPVTFSNTSCLFWALSLRVFQRCMKFVSCFSWFFLSLGSSDFKSCFPDSCKERTLGERSSNIFCKNWMKIKQGVTKKKKRKKWQGTGKNKLNWTNENLPSSHLYSDNKTMAILGKKWHLNFHWSWMYI